MTTQNTTAILAAAGIVIVLAIAVGWVHNHPPAPGTPNTAGQQSENSAQGTLTGTVVGGASVR